MQETAERGPRLQIGHLMIWVVGLAIGLAQARLSLSRDDPDARSRTIAIVGSLAFAVALGTNLAGCGLLAYRHWKGDTSCPSRAGHWLMIRALASYVAILPFRWAWPGMYLPAYQWILLLVNLGFLWHLRHRLPSRWVAVFLASAIMAALQAIALTRYGKLGFRYRAFLWSTLVLAGDLLEAALIVRDRRAGAPADGLHRLGVWTALALDLFPLAFRLALAIR